MDYKEKIHNGMLYVTTDDSLIKEQNDCLELLYDYNTSRPKEVEKRKQLLKQMFAEIGENCYIEPPLHSNWGCKNVHFGKNVYANFNLTFVDDTHIYVGDNTMFGPSVILATAGHPVLPELREKLYQFNEKIVIGKNCWLGAGVIVIPGVKIGNNSVIGAGSIVTKNIPDNVVAFGNPCKVIREISEKDKEFYFKDRKIEL